MTKELVHASVGTDLSQTEWESINTHTLTGGAAGDILFFDGANIKGLAVGTGVLGVSAGAPAWVTTLTGITLASPTITGAITSTGLTHSPAIGANSALVAWGGTITEAASGAHSRLALLELTAPTITGAGATVTDTATLYISGAMTATVTGANYSLWVDSGAVQLDSTLGVGSTLTVQGGGLVVQAGGSTIQAGGLNVQAGGASITGGTTLATGNLIFSTTAQRITGDFSNATRSNRVSFQSSTVNGSTVLQVVPNGTSVVTGLQMFNVNDPDNAGFLNFAVNGAGATLTTSKVGTGTEPTSFSIGSLGGTAWSFNTSTLASTFGAAVSITGGLTATTGNITVTAGNLTFGGTAQRVTGDFSNATVASRVAYQSSTTNGATNLGAIPNGTSTASSITLYNTSDTANAGYTSLSVTSTVGSVTTGRTGTGTEPTTLTLTTAAGTALSVATGTRVVTISTGLTVTAGGQTITAGNLVLSAGSISLNSAAPTLGIGTTAATNQIIRMVSTINAASGLGLGWNCAPTIFAAANGDELTAVYGGLSINENSKTGLIGTFIHILAPAGTTAATTYTAILIDTGWSGIKIGGNAVRSGTKPTNQIDLFNGTSPTGTLTNGTSLYARAGEMYAMDAAGNETIQSPHDYTTGEWIFWSKHTPTGKVLRVDMERLVKAVNEHFGWEFVQEFIEAA